MKICPNCNAQLEDSAVFCYNCGAKFVSNEAQGAQAPQTQPIPAQTQYEQQPQAQKPVPNYDHTAEFDPNDISKNKVFAMACYLMGTLGMLIALLASSKSEYAMFHVRQSLKINMASLLLGLATLLLCWTIIVPIAAGIVTLILLVVRIICFFQICNGKAMEPFLVRSLPFMR